MGFSLVHLPTGEFVLKNKSKEDISNLLKTFVFSSIKSTNNQVIWSLRRREDSLNKRSSDEIIHETAEFEITVDL